MVSRSTTFFATDFWAVHEHLEPDVSHVEGGTWADGLALLTGADQHPWALHRRQQAVTERRATRSSVSRAALAPRADPVEFLDVGDAEVC